ncbi:unnamed protein product [Sphagnum tenellum]
MLGDWHDSRHSLHVSTMNYSLRAMQMLNDAFEVVHWIPGNHDLFYRDKRDVSSIEFAKHLPNIQIVRKPTTVAGVTFLPWLVGDEARITAKEFVNQDYVFSGHFHIRQQKGRVVYTGNIMPFNFSDNWDEDRGMMLLEWGKEPEFRAWPGQPLFRTMRLSELLDKPQALLRPGMTARVAMDIDISYEEAQLIKDTFITDYGLRKLELAPQTKSSVDNQEFSGEVIYQTVDQIVVDGLLSIDSVGLKAEKLVEIYKSLPNL